MLPLDRQGDGETGFVLLHWLGGGAQSWTEVARALAARGASVVSIDLPGFGDAARDRRWSVNEMRDAVLETIAFAHRHRPAARWFLGGHSMGGKVALAVAATRPAGLAGLTLVSSSPPGPEPIGEDKRAALIAHFDGASFLDDNLGVLPLPHDRRARTLRGFETMSLGAFVHWLTSGSREDLRAAIGVLDLPALLLCGSEEMPLGEAAQRELVMPHVPRANVVVVHGAAHLAPLEQPDVVAEHCARLAGVPPRPRPPGASFETLVRSTETSRATRLVMHAREREVTGPGWLGDHELGLLRCLVAEIVPTASLSIVARIDRDLASGRGDGHRNGELPEDRVAWRQGLAALDTASNEAHHGVGFVGVDRERRLAVLEALAGASAVRLKDARAEIVKAYVSEASTMVRRAANSLARWRQHCVSSSTTS